MLCIFLLAIDRLFLFCVLLAITSVGHVKKTKKKKKRVIVIVVKVGELREHKAFALSCRRFKRQVLTG